MAVFFLMITLVGFIPDSLSKLAIVEAGTRPPFPFVLHVYAVLMGSFLLLLLAQSTLAATGRQAYHQQLGLAAVVHTPALVIAGVILVPTMYHQFWSVSGASRRTRLQNFRPRSSWACCASRTSC